MNNLVIIGNLTKDPELRVTTSGINVCTFTVAVNRRGGEDAGADFFRVTVWRERATVCEKFLSKGRKVCVVGPVSLHEWESENGKRGAALEVTAQSVEFLSPRVSDSAADTSPAPAARPEQRVDTASGFTAVDTGELPF